MFDPLAIFYRDSKTGKPSSSVLWENIGYAAATYVFIKADSDDWEFMAAYLTLVTANKIGSYWIKRRYERPTVGNNDDKRSNPDN